MATKRIVATGETVEVTPLSGAELTSFREHQEDLQTRKQVENDAIAQKETDKANAKAKLIAGEPLTEDKANEIVL